MDTCRRPASRRRAPAFESSRKQVILLAVIPTFTLFTAGPRGFEPRSTVLETVILPLNYRPKRGAGRNGYSLSGKFLKARLQ